MFGCFFSSVYSLVSPPLVFLSFPPTVGFSIFFVIVLLGIFHFSPCSLFPCFSPYAVVSGPVRFGSVRFGSVRLVNTSVAKKSIYTVIPSTPGIVCPQKLGVQFSRDIDKMQQRHV